MHLTSRIFSLGGCPQRREIVFEWARAQISARNKAHMVSEAPSGIYRSKYVGASQQRCIQEITVLSAVSQSCLGISARRSWPATSCGSAPTSHNECTMFRSCGRIAFRTIQIQTLMQALAEFVCDRRSSVCKLFASPAWQCAWARLGVWG